MSTAARRLQPYLIAASLFAIVTGANMILERPGLGIGHFFYIPIVIVAIVGGPWVGAAGGLAATVLYYVCIVVNPHTPPALELEQTAIRMTTFCAVGVVVGTYSMWRRTLVDELEKLASRDQLTGLPNTRAFEDAIARRLAAGRPFALVVGDVDELRGLNEIGRDVGDDALRRLADKLHASRRGDEVARIGGDEFAVLADLPLDGARAVALSLEASLEFVTFGWAAFPDEGDNALALYRVADERLYARKVTRGYRRGFAQTPA